MKNTLFLCWLCFLGGLNACVSADSVFWDGEIHLEGAPGEVRASGADARVILNSGGIPVVSCSPVGRGEVWGFGHEQFFEVERFPELEDLFEEIFPAQEAGNRILCYEADDLHASLSERGFHTVGIDSLPEDFSGWDAIILSLGAIRQENLSEAHLESLHRAVEEGTRLLVSSIGWVFMSYGGNLNGEDLGGDLNANRICAPLGLYFGEGWGSGVCSPPAAENSGVDYGYLERAAGRVLTGREVAVPSEELQGLRRVLDGVDPRWTALWLEEIYPGFLSRLSDLAVERMEDLVPSPENPVPVGEGLTSTWILLLDALEPLLEETSRSAFFRMQSFPGAIEAASSDDRTTVDSGTWGLVPTGYYAPPGSTIRAFIPEALAGKRVSLQIGIHDDDLFRFDRSDPWIRWPQVIRRHVFRGTEIELYTPFGGPVCLHFYKPLDTGRVEIFLEGGIPDEGAPWTTIQGQWVVLTLPREVARDISNPRGYMEQWDAILDSYYALSGETCRNYPEWITGDLQLSSGYMHSGYPILSHNDILPNYSPLHPESILEYGNWGVFHELGHNFQQRDWTFSGAGEVTCNLFNLYVWDRIFGRSPEAMMESRGDSRAAYFSNGADFEEWKTDPFLALWTYIELQQRYGWEAFQRVFRRYLELGAGEHPSSEAEKREFWVRIFSEETRTNLFPYFTEWGWPLSEGLNAELSRFPARGR